MVAAPTRYSLQGWHRNANEVPRPRWSLIIPRTASTALYCTGQSQPLLLSQELSRYMTEQSAPPLPYITLVIPVTFLTCRILNIQILPVTSYQLPVTPPVFIPPDPAQ